MADEMKSLVIALRTNLCSVFVGEDDYPKVTLDIEEINANQYFTVLLMAMSCHHADLTGNTGMDLIAFTHLLNGLAVEYLMEHGTLKTEEVK